MNPKNFLNWIKCTMCEFKVMARFFKGSSKPEVSKLWLLPVLYKTQAKNVFYVLIGFSFLKKSKDDIQQRQYVATSLKYLLHYPQLMSLPSAAIYTNHIQIE